MKNLLLALALTLAALPMAASADDAPVQPVAPTRPVMSPAQRQAMEKTMEQFRSKAMELHQQLRAQLLGALSPAHRSAVAQAIGDLAMSEHPDPGAAAKRIDGILTPDERQKVLTAQDTFVQQSRAAMQQIRDQFRAELPSPPPGAPRPEMGGPMPARTAQWHTVTDPGTILLTTLNGGPMGMRFGQMGPHGVPSAAMPPGAPPDGAPPMPPAGAPPQR